MSVLTYRLRFDDDILKIAALLSITNHKLRLFLILPFTSKQEFEFNTRC
jgi:hypothetical protein